MNWNEIYSMSLGESKIFDGLSLATVVLRVPGGWVISQVDKAFNLCSSCFVPFDNEFQDAKP